MKICKDCNQKFPATEEFFFKDRQILRSRCKACYAIYNKKYKKIFRENHRDEIKEYNKKYKPQYRQKNKEKLNLTAKIRMANKRRTDPAFRVRSIISRNILLHLKKENPKFAKEGSLWNILPYSPQDLRCHLESLFEDWMTWENYGVASTNKRTWHIDHIIPQSLLPYTSFEDENFQKCWALSNLRPLDAIDNIKKGNKI